MDLDDVVPAPEHVTRQSRQIAAPPAVVWEELHRVTLSSVPVSALLIGVRFLPALMMRGKRRLPLDRSFVDVLPIPVLSSEPPTALVMGGLLQPWRPTGGAGPVLGAAEIRNWNEPGWVKVAMEFRLIPADGATVLRTETRVAATDRASALLFSGYWLFVRPGSSAIRHEVLAAVAQRAQARAATVS
jgi:hypothetical protein